MKINNLKPFETYKECVDFFYENKKNEYEINFNDGLISTHHGLLYEQNLYRDVIKLTPTRVKLIVNEHAVIRFHPNEIDNQKFWSYCKTKFPKFSVCGSKVKSIKECNKTTLEFTKSTGLYEILEKEINNSNKKLNMLEIGFGHGNVFFDLKDKVNYVGIDFHKIKSLNKYKRLMVIKESGIPDDIIIDNSLDIIYSINVLQHCSQKDRFSYISQAYDKLKPGGIFIGSCLLETADNSSSDVWGIEDGYGRKYCNFFNQLTEVDKEHEFVKHVKDTGFKIQTAQVAGIQHLLFVLRK